MEGTGQNFFVSERLGNTELNRNWGTIAFDNSAPKIGFGKLNCEEFQGFEPLLADESSNDQSGANTHDQEDASFDDYAVDLERMIMEEEPQSMPESISGDEIVGVELDPEWDVSMFDDNSTTIDAENSNCADFGFQRDQLWLGEEDSNQGTSARDQDIAFMEFAHDLERMIVQEHRPRLPVSVSNEIMQTPEIGATEQVVASPRPVVPPTESIGVTYHRKNKQWEAHLWLKNQQHRNNRKKNGVQLFLGNFATSDEAKQAHDRAAIKLGILETSRAKAYPLNFPESAHAGYIAEHVGWSARDFLWKLRRSSAKFNKGKSRMKGVSMRKGKKTGSPLYEAKISKTSSEGEKMTFNLGMFESEDDAGKAYDRALLFLKGVEEFTSVTNFRPSGYSAEEIEEAGSSLLSE